jgi:uncharacterized membrane protein
MTGRENIQQHLKKLDLKKLDTRSLSFLALFIAFTAVATYLHIPGPSSSLTFGAKAGGIAGGVGAALMDLILGYSIWAPFTFLIKGLEGFIAGKIASQNSKEKFDRKIFAIIVAGNVMILGYAIAKAFLLSWAVVLPEIGIDFAQMIIGGILAIPLSHHLDNYFRK